MQVGRSCQQLTGFISQAARLEFDWHHQLAAIQEAENLALGRFDWFDLDKLNACTVAEQGQVRTPPEKRPSPARQP